MLFRKVRDHAAAVSSHLFTPSNRTYKVQTVYHEQAKRGKEIYEELDSCAYGSRIRSLHGNSITRSKIALYIERNTLK